ncbi:MAG TPA: alpha/beta fold hydrolase [Myxococcaceae bacterium]|nr:alpha/beta fold hydrolase [Myxococcaceae bacterium]
MRLHFRDVGSGPPVVLLHAFPLLGEMFEPQWSALAGRARFVVPDLRGFGGSSAGAGPSEMATMADDVLALIDHLGIDSAVVGGVSMGGYASLALLRNDPSRVRALVLADTQTAADDAAGREVRERTALELLAKGSTALLPLVDRLLRPGAPEALRTRVSGWITGGSAEGLAAALRGMALRPDARDILARFGGPVLVVVGAEDVLTPPAKARAMVELVPGAELVEIPSAGHLANLEQPEAFNAALGRFLDRVRARSPG